MASVVTGIIDLEISDFVSALLGYNAGDSYPMVTRDWIYRYTCYCSGGYVFPLPRTLRFGLSRIDNLHGAESDKVTLSCQHLCSFAC